MKIFRVMDAFIELCGPYSLGGNGSDTYDGFIVAAESESDVDRIINEFAGTNNGKWTWIYTYHQNKTPTIELIGTAAPNIKEGVLFYSWSSSG